jgi:hypothetical protein
MPRFTIVKRQEGNVKKKRKNFGKFAQKTKNSTAYSFKSPFFIAPIVKTGNLEKIENSVDGFPAVPLENRRRSFCV